MPPPNLPQANPDEALCSLAELEAATREMLRRARLYRRTGGVHSAAAGDGLHLHCCEDAGRCNALDKALGHALLCRMEPARTFLLLTGRISFETLHKAAMAGVGLLASLNIPSELAVEAANACGITLVGNMCGAERHIYTHPWRLRAPSLP